MKNTEEIESYPIIWIILAIIYFITGFLLANKICSFLNIKDIELSISGLPCTIVFTFLITFLQLYLSLLFVNFCRFIISYIIKEQEITQ